MTVFVAQRNPAPAANETPAPELFLYGKFVTTACSATCKCVVTSTCTLDGFVRSISVNKCQRDHDAVMEKLRSAAEFHVRRMAGISMVAKEQK